MNETTPSPLGNVITIDDERIKSHLDRVVRGSVEETLNALLDAEADRLCNAQRYERSEARRDTRAGHYERKLQTKAGEVHLKIPKLRQQTFETAIIERYRRREAAVEETLTYYGFPEEHWRRIRTNNPLERILREIRRRTRVVGAFPDGQSALNLAAARLRHIAGTAWSTKRYLNIELLKDQQMRGAITA
jgi:transposase-like protein